MKRIFSLLGLALSLLQLASSSEIWAKHQIIEPNVVDVIQVNKAITPGVFEEVTRALFDAKVKKHSALMIEMNSPGAFRDDAYELSQLILSSDIPVIIWVGPEGAEANGGSAYVVLAAHFATMQLDARLGPFTFTNAIRGKSKNNFLNDRSHDADLLESMAERLELNLPQIEKIVSNESSLSAEEAQNLKIIDALASNREDTWKAFRQKFPLAPEHPDFRIYRSNAKERTLSWISNPNVAFALLAVGALGIYTEITFPGIVIPGAIGSLALGVGALTLRWIPIRAVSLLAILIGIFFIALEVLSPFPTYGFSGLAGALCLFFGGFFLVDKTESDLVLDPAIWLPIFITVLAVIIFFGYQSIRAMRAKPYGNGIDALIAEDGEVLNVLNDKEATVKIHKDIWTARWHSAAGRNASFKEHQKIKVVEQRGFTVFVIEKTSNT